MKHASLRIPVDNGVNPLTKRCFNLLPFGSRLNGSGRCRNGRDINLIWLFRLFLKIFGYLLPIVVLTNPIWSKSQIRGQLTACGDVEKNPGPESAEKLIFQPSSLKVIQLNCSSYTTSKVEIQHLLDVHQPDVMMIQESWLNEKKVCKPLGYHVERRDRVTARGGVGAMVKGGGLLTFIKDCSVSRSKFSIVQMVPLDLGDDDVSEVLQVKLLWKESSVVFSNIYVPPIRPAGSEHRVQRFKADNVLEKCVSSCSVSQHIIAGDFNAHSTLWDNYCVEDELGEDIHEWCMDANVDIANDGAVTYMSRADARKSTPDITISSVGLVVSDWRVKQPISSDHLPVSFSVSFREPGEVERERTVPIKTKLSIKKADWTLYNETTKKLIASWPMDGGTDKEKEEWIKKGGVFNMHQRAHRLHRCLAMASKVIPQGCRRDPVPWWHPDIDEAITIRDHLREEADVCEDNRLEWVEACQGVTEIIKRSRLVFWRDFSTTLNYSTDPSKVATIIQSINREPRPTTNIAIVNADGKVLSTDYKKATAFRGEYAKVCSNVHNEETRTREYKARHRLEKIRVQDYLRKPSNIVLKRLNFHQLSLRLDSRP